MKARHYIAFGDIHERAENAARIPGLAEAHGVIVTGDLTTRGGRKAALEVLGPITAANPRVYAQIGNMDGPEVDALLTEKGLNIHARAVDLGQGLGMLGVGWSTPTPFGTPSETDDATIGGWLEEAYSQAKGFDRLLLVVHNPPVDTKADVLGGGVHVGSKAVRAFIEKVRPPVVLTGHIHEAASTDMIGPSTVINPGMLSAGGYVLVTDSADGLGAELKRI